MKAIEPHNPYNDGYLILLSHISELEAELEALRSKPCPHIVSGDEGTSYCGLNLHDKNEFERLERELEAARGQMETLRDCLGKAEGALMELMTDYDASELKLRIQEALCIPAKEEASKGEVECPINHNAISVGESCPSCGGRVIGIA